MPKTRPRQRLAKAGWMLQVTTHIEGATPVIQNFIAGYDTKPEAIAAVRTYPGVETTAKIVPQKVLSKAEIKSLKLKDGEARQYD